MNLHLLLDILICIVIAVFVYRSQNGRNFSRTIKDAQNIIARTAKRMNPNNGSADTASALLNKPCIISDDAYSETRNDIIALPSKDAHFTRNSISESKYGSQSQVTSTREHQSKKGRTPLFDGVRPYQNIPFQFSLHVQERPDGELRHYEYLADGRKDPRPELLESLGGIIGESGSILAYNKSFEERVLEESAQAFPGPCAWVNGAISRLVDLIIPFRSFHYYHPRQGGSVSLKKVLPAITGRGYDDMAIARGDDASLAFLRITFDDVSTEEAEEVRTDLLTYCKLDTGGMVSIVERLEELSG